MRDEDEEDGGEEDGGEEESESASGGVRERSRAVRGSSRIGCHHAAVCSRSIIHYVAAGLCTCRLMVWMMDE